ncbi:MAG: hypothetical protein NZM29_05720, partial [Nitrospira sp.]|nr:hypothetical protein [Nitrospira sp.]
QPENNSYGVGLGFRCAKSARAISDDMRREARDAFIQTLVLMGAEKYAGALSTIEKALAIDPDNQEYLATRELIQKAMKRNK